MQHSRCGEMQILISKYADGEATPAERERVDAHTAACEGCAGKLTAYMEVAAIFSESPMRAPEPHLRTTLFTEITRINDQARRQETHRPKSERPWYLPEPTSRAPQARTSFGMRLWRAASPFAASAAAVLTLVALLMVGADLRDETPTNTVSTKEPELGFVPVPTSPATVVVSQFPPDSQGIPEPQQTRIQGLASPPVVETASVTRRATATVLFELANSTPVFEEGDPSTLASWHVLRDADYGYTVAYPPNWWTQAQRGVRYFYPWQDGGTRYAPYWIELGVEPNNDKLTAETANIKMFSGTCDVVPAMRNGTHCLRRNFADEQNMYDELYGFDAQYMYRLRLVVPLRNATADFQTRWGEAQDVYARMTGSVSISPVPSAGASMYRQVIFQNGTDLWSVDMEGRYPAPVTRSGGVKTYAVAPDLSRVAYASTSNLSDLWANEIYLARLDSGSHEQVWTGGEVHDIEWYNGTQLLVLARSGRQLGLYKLSVPSYRVADNGTTHLEPELIVELGDDLPGARDLSVSPDRQLITFLAPLGEDERTNVYAVRPDGTDLSVIVSHVEASGLKGAGEQAIKSYSWSEGHLESGGYAYNLLFTAGNAQSPTLYRGGRLFSAPVVNGKPVLEPAALNVEDVAKLQIVHMATSSTGKLAFTGFYSLRDSRVETLAGLWTATLAGGKLRDIARLPVPAAPYGITDLQWAQGGESLVYRETRPANEASFISRYDSQPFRMMRLDPATGATTVLYDATNR